MEHRHETYCLEDIDQAHTIGAALFVPVTIIRLRGDTTATHTMLTVELRNFGNLSSLQRTLYLSWSSASAPTQPLGVPDRVITEWAACGIACVVMVLYTGLTVRAVTAEGDRFDYWVDDGQQEYGLEVSDTLGTDLEARHRAKVRQLCDNPYGADGYVVVVSFATRCVVFSSVSGGKPMTYPVGRGLNRQGVDAAFAVDEAQKSLFLLEAQLLRAQQQAEAAAEKCVEAARLEEQLQDRCFGLGLQDKAFVHAFSAASCRAQAGDCHHAISVCQDLLAHPHLPARLRQRVEAYVKVLCTRRAQWYAELFVHDGE